MKTEIQWAELHAPLFLAGTNLGMKLDPKQRKGLTLEYDEDKRHLYAQYGGKTARIPETSVLSMVEADQRPVIKAVASHPFQTTPQPPLATAQVSTPMSHVHAGPGHGQTGQEPLKPRVGKPPANAPKVEL